MMHDTTFNEEKSQTKARIIISLLTVIIFVGMYLTQPTPRSESLVDALWLTGVYGCFGSIWLVFLNRYPNRWLWRRYITIIADIAIVTATLNLTGASGAYFYPVYLWVIVGNGLRFGQRHLLFGVLSALTGFGLLLQYNSFWLANRQIGTGLMFGIFILPLFYLTVLRRMKLLNERLAVELENSKVAEKAKGEFLANMSHEIRTPLNGVLGMADILNDSALDTDQKQSLDIIIRSGQALLCIINDILDFSKITSGQMTIETTAFNLSQVIQDVYLLLKPAAEEKGIDLTVEIPTDLAQSYLGDPTRVRQILFNLVGNAIKFTESGQVEIITAQDEDNQLNISVRDTGIGIPADRVDAIFEQFEQASMSTARIFGGTGLGLAICRQLTKLMGGSIRVVSTEGEGSEFIVILPLPESEANVALVNASDERPSFHLHALVAEDNTVNQMVARRHLKRLGITCEVVDNGRIAVETLNDSFDFVLMDVRMPVMNGLEATENIRRRPDELADIPIIALTADASTQDKTRSLTAGMTTHISKPLRTDDLIKVLTEIFCSEGNSAPLVHQDLTS